ncbi:MAG: hypothetical protein JXX29_05610 [Deltaproteobacteria bacterium]|nr:hypothetical protein [Deltaproteobacteria bacterium]MBN2671126.1 hypothetical protein [Deltaproteobacteria bacterium]
MGFVVKSEVLLAVACGLTILLLSQRTWADSFYTDTTSKPVVIVFLTSSHSGQMAAEQEFVTALKLSLDRFKVVSIDVSDAAFSAVPLSQRLKIIASYTAQWDAVASIWLEEVENDIILLNLAAMSTGRALVRIIEAENSPSASEELAFAAQELLGEAYLFEAEPGKDAVAKTVQTVKEKIPENPHEHSRGIGIMPFFELGRGLYGHRGPSFQLGGGLDLMFPVRASIHARIGGGGVSGPNAPLLDGIISMNGAFLRTVLDYRKKFRWLSLGGEIGVATFLRFVDMALGESGNQEYTILNFRAFTGVNVSFPLTSKTHLSFGGTLGTLFLRKRFRRLSDNAIVVATPLADWSLSVGMLIFL